MGRVNGVLMQKFESKEFKHPEMMDQTFLLFLDKVRELAEFPFHLTSDGRTQAENDALKGSGSAATSLHLKGRAVDFSWPKEKPWEEFARLTMAVISARNLMPNLFGYELEFALDRHIHLGLFLDDRPDRVIIAAT